jgi:hypothetical protein
MNIDPLLSFSDTGIISAAGGKGAAHSLKLVR